MAAKVGLRAQAGPPECDLGRPVSSPPMIQEASFTGTAKVILVLLGIWLVARWWMRRSTAMSSHQARGETRSKGDVRIEDLRPGNGSAPNHGNVTDAEFEEIK